MNYLNEIGDKTMVLVLIATGLIISAYFGINFMHKNNTQPKIAFIHTQYAADFSDDRILVGAAHNIFVGKVIRQISTKERGIGPETQFEVDVIDNIKGDLNGAVTVNQQGGYKEGVLYVVENSSGILQKGSTYLFVTRYNEQEDWYTMNSYYTANELLSGDVNAQSSTLKTLSENNARVNELRQVYPDEILLEVDKSTGNVRNSYRSLVTQ